MSHVIDKREHTQTSWVITCTCGKQFTHRDSVGAEGLFEYHAGLENARLALRGGRG